MASAEDVGKKLLGEVEEVGLDEILRTLRVKNGSSTPPFLIPPLDRLLEKITEARPNAAKTHTTPPLIELMSLAPGGGKTHLLYHLCAPAVLPHHLSGKQACVVIIDTDNNFSVQRLATQIQLLLRTRKPAIYSGEDRTEVTNDETLTALKHVHIFRPQSLASTIATLDSLPAYLFNSTRHHSFDRQVAFIAIDSGSAFYWQDRAETEDATFLASTSSKAEPKPPPQPSGYVALSASLRAATKTFSCPAIMTTCYHGPVNLSQQHPQDSRSFRPPLPVLQPTLRLVVHRLAVRKFPPGISVEQALREAGDRQKAVDEGKFGCFVNEWGLDEQVLMKVGGGFGFRIRGEGVLVDEG